MAGFVDTTVKEIDDRLRSLKEEVARLEAVRAALIGARRGPGRPRGSSRNGRRRGRPRGRRGGGTRANQALDLVRKQPGVTIPQLAQTMRIEPNYLYRVMPKLVEEGQVRREGQAWYAASRG